MDSRWRNLLVLFVLVIAAFFVFSLLQQPRQPVASVLSPINSFDAGQAAVSAVLLSYDWFDAKHQQIKNPNENELQDAKQEMIRLRTEVEKGPLFGDKKAVLSLFDAWITRLDLALTWVQLKKQKGAATFLGNESNAEICSKKDFFVSLKQQLQTARDSLSKTDEAQNSFVTGFSVLAVRSGFDRQTDSSQQQFGLDAQLEAVNDILGACS